MYYAQVENMSAIHEQAMNYVYQQVLQRMLEHLTRAQRTSLQLLIQRLTVTAGGIERIGSFRLMVPFSGSMDGACAVAFLRAAQLSIASRTPATFNLRVVTWVHAGLSATTLGNIERCYSALFLHDDPRVELLVGDWPYPRAYEYKTLSNGMERDRRRHDALFAGHLTAGDERAAFGVASGLELGGLLERAVAWGEGADAVVCTAPRRDRKRCSIWLARLAREFGEALPEWEQFPLSALTRTLIQVGRAWHRELHGAEPHILIPTHTYSTASMLSVSDLVGEPVEERWPLLGEFLAYEVDDGAFACDELGTPLPLLVGHLLGLSCEHLEQGSYAEGVSPYLASVRGLMQRRCMPEALIEQFVRQDDIERRRMAANSYMMDTLQITEAQLVCMLFSPFTDKGIGLERFLRQCHPGMLVAQSELHRALGGQQAPDQVRQWLIEVSGMSPQTLARLYSRQRIDQGTVDNVIARVLGADPSRLRRCGSASPGPT